MATLRPWLLREAASAMEVLLEIVVEILGQLAFELLLEGGFRGLARLLSNRVARALLGAGLGIAGGYVAGYWWGSRLTELGRTDPPKSLWVSIGLAVLFVTLAIVQALRRRSGDAGPEPSGRMAKALAVWQWSVVRLLGFALLNAAVATGIAVGFTPRVLR